MKRYLLFIALLGLGFNACKNEQAITPTPEKQLDLKASKKAGSNTPHTVIQFAERVNACANTYLANIGSSGDTPSLRTQFKACLGNIDPPIPTGPTNNPYPSAGGPAAHEPHADYNRPRTLQELAKLAGITSPTTTQDSVDRFVNAYKNVDLIVRNSPSTSKDKLATQLDYAIMNGLGGYVLTIAGGIAFPNQGMSYLMSLYKRTFKIPLHWEGHGFNLYAPYDFQVETLPDGL